MKKSWKTTLAGVLGGCLILVGGSLKDRATNPAAPPVTFGNVLPAVVVAAIGALAKDGDK